MNYELQRAGHQMDIALIGVGWGAARLRAFAFDPKGEVIATRQSEHGVTHLGRLGFGEALLALVVDWLVAGDEPLLLAGRVGGREGWVETPALPAPATIHQVAAALHPVHFANRQAAIVPGLDIGGPGFTDVLRGEETVAFGLSPEAGCVVVLGTYSRWIHLDDGRIDRFASYPTADLETALTTPARPARGTTPTWSEAAFLDGVETARRSGDWLRQLFGVRARTLLGGSPDKGSPSFLSGLLIGYECLTALADADSPAEVTVVGSAPQSDRYRLALSAFGVRVSVIDFDRALTRGLWRIARAAGW